MESKDVMKIVSAVVTVGAAVITAIAAFINNMKQQQYVQQMNTVPYYGYGYTYQNAQPIQQYQAPVQPMTQYIQQPVQQYQTIPPTTNQCVQPVPCSPSCPPSYPISPIVPIYPFFPDNRELMWENDPCAPTPSMNGNSYINPIYWEKNNHNRAQSTTNDYIGPDVRTSETFKWASIASSPMTECGNGVVPFFDIPRRC